MSQFKWQPSSQLTAVDQQNAKKWQTSPLLAHLFASRGLTSLNKQRLFLNPDLSQLHSPWLFKDMDLAVKTIKQAIQNHKKILIYGDYDVDGLTATTIMFETLEILGADVSYYIPDRIKDGYGPNILTYRRLINTGINLIITVDNGVAGYDAIKYARDHHVDVVITDHHQLGKKLPPANAIIHPLLSPEYPFKDICGAGVSFKVASALLGYWATDLIDLAALGTVSDVMPLVDENRAILTLGLNLLRQSNRVGITNLLKIADIQPQDIDEMTIGFQIAPRLNALGRMQNAMPGVALLNSSDSMAASQLADKINDLNTMRRLTVNKVTDTIVNATDPIKKSWHLDNPALIITGNDWPAGILGIVASNITDSVNKPTIVAAAHDSDSASGSGRSVEGFNLFEALNPHRDLMNRFGGHPMACGLSIPINNLNLMRQALCQAAVDQKFVPHPPTNQADLVYPYDMDPETVFDQIDQLAPFGNANDQPIFDISRFTVLTARQVGDQKQHLQLKLKIDASDNSIEAIGFNLGSEIDCWRQGSNWHIFGTLNRHTWRQRTTIQLQILDIAQL